MCGCLVFFMTPLNESLFRLMSAFEEFRELQKKMGHFEDTVGETGHGDAGHIELGDNQTDVENIGTVDESKSDDSVIDETRMNEEDGSVQ